MSIVNWIEPHDATFSLVSKDDWLNTDSLEAVLKTANIPVHAFAPGDVPPWSVPEIVSLIEAKTNRQFVVISTDFEAFSFAFATMAVEQGYDTYLVAPLSEPNAFRALVRGQSGNHSER